MKSSIKITSYGKTLGIIETREYHFNEIGSVGVLLHALIDFIKEFSADRAKRKVVISVEIDKRS